MSASELEAEVREYKLQLETVQSGIQADPDNEELQTLKKELEEVITLTEVAIAELKPKPVDTQRSTSPPKEKWSKENHPAFQPGFRRPGAPAAPSSPVEKEEPASYKVNDTVMAKWKSGDKAFYPAKITSITGSSSKPVYLVTFKGYNNTETLFAHDIKPSTSHAGQKRKADSQAPTGATIASASPSTPTFGLSQSPGVISAAATVDPALASAVRKPEPSKVSDGPPRPTKVPKKIKANKELEAGKSKWQEFSTHKGKMGKLLKKESMFKTGEGVNARVGFTGSGQAMRKDQARIRHTYDQGKEDDL